MVINELLDEIKEELACIPDEDRMQLIIDFPDKVTVNGNLSLLGSIFRNLTENAISYSEGSAIHIALAENSPRYCRIIFEDDGVGVDEKNLPRLFERFYRVDKGRSRNKGGTISVSNRLDGGLRFEFTLEKRNNL